MRRSLLLGVLAGTLLAGCAAVAPGDTPVAVGAVLAPATGPTAPLCIDVPGVTPVWATGVTSKMIMAL